MEIGDLVKCNPRLMSGGRAERRSRRGAVIRVWHDPSGIERVDVRFGHDDKLDVDYGVSIGQFVPWDGQ